MAFASNLDDLVSGDTDEVTDGFVHSRTTGRTVLVSAARAGAQGNGASFEPAMGASGLRVAFVSAADNLTSGRDTNGSVDVFLRDRSAP